MGADDAGRGGRCLGLLDSKWKLYSKSSLRVRGQAGRIDGVCEGYRRTVGWRLGGCVNIADQIRTDSQYG